MCSTCIVVTYNVYTFNISIKFNFNIFFLEHMSTLKLIKYQQPTLLLLYLAAVSADSPYNMMSGMD